MRRRFQEAIDWGFDGNLSLAARVLNMPFSTVQQYYQRGPRRVSPAVVKKIDQVMGLGRWIVGEADPGPTGKYCASVGEATRWRLITVTINAEDGKQEVGYPYPVVVLWRISRVLAEMARRGDKREDSMEDLFFKPIEAAIKERVLRAPRGMRSLRIDPDTREVTETPSAVIRKGMPRKGKSPADILGYDIGAARRIHRLCEYWETELEIGAPYAVR